MYELAQEADKSLTDIVLSFVEDGRTWFGLDEQLVQTFIRKDAEALKLTQRDYISYLLTQRCMAIKEHGVGWEKGELKVALARRR
jgi:hypothetical protein